LKIRIKDKLSADLALRDAADLFFDEIERMKIDVEVDFSDIRSISRSFAHQYLIRKNQSDKNITELNVPDHIVKMFYIVSKSRQKSNILDIDSMPVISL
jgi:hypothetical protein